MIPPSFHAFNRHGFLTGGRVVPSCAIIAALLTDGNSTLGSRIDHVMAHVMWRMFHILVIALPPIVKSGKETESEQ
jgi:hypothetical protein